MIDQIVSGACSLAGVIIGFCLSEIKEKLKRAVLKFSRLEFQRLQDRCRIFLVVKHSGGSLPVDGASGYLTIYYEGTDKFLPEKIFVQKLSPSSCSLSSWCTFCRLKIGDMLTSPKTYLAEFPSSKISDEPLPWTISIESGRGLEGLEYKHLVNIPVSGTAKLALLDIFKVGTAGELFYLVKVHSEYGTEGYPRVCFKLPVHSELDGKIVFAVRVSGGNVRKAAECQLKIASCYSGKHVQYYLRFHAEGVREKYDFEEILSGTSSVVFGRRDAI